MTHFKAEHFSDESYSEILDVVLLHGYKPIKLTEASFALSCGLKSKCLLLRHDVDISPMGAIKLGQMEKEKSVISNFFFQLNSGTYQMLSKECITICKELQSMGHLVGLHVDSALFAEDEDKIRGTIDWIRENLFQMDYAVSFHRPQPQSLGKRYKSFVSAYSDDVFNIDYYASDSRGEDRFYEKIDILLDRQVQFFQLLLHPCWWEKEIDKSIIRDRILARNKRYVDDYLVNNFPKVFKEVILKERENV